MRRHVAFFAFSAKARHWNHRSSTLRSRTVALHNSAMSTKAAIPKTMTCFPILQGAPGHREQLTRLAVSDAAKFPHVPFLNEHDASLLAPIEAGIVFSLHRPSGKA